VCVWGGVGRVSRGLDYPLLSSVLAVSETRGLYAGTHVGLWIRASLRGLYARYAVRSGSHTLRAPPLSSVPVASRPFVPHSISRPDTHQPQTAAVLTSRPLLPAHTRPDKARTQRVTPIDACEARPPETAPHVRTCALINSIPHSLPSLPRAREPPKAHKPCSQAAASRLSRLRSTLAYFPCPTSRA
jgi:hypothetical protein